MSGFSLVYSPIAFSGIGWCSAGEGIVNRGAGDSGLLNGQIVLYMISPLAVANLYMGWADV